MTVNIDELLIIKDLMESVANLKKLCDVKLVSGIDKQKLHAHRLILVASSKYFEKVLGLKCGKGAEKEIVFADINSSTLSAVLDFIYFGRIEITEENIGEFIAAASSMELIGLAEKCGQFWASNLTPGNCVEAYLNADKYHLTKLCSSAMKFICDNFEAIPIESIQQIEEKHFRKLLNCDGITAAETVIFDRLVAWMDKNKVAEEKIDSNLLKSIRLVHIPTTFLVEKIEPLWKKYGCDDLIIMEEYWKRSLHPHLISLHRFGSSPSIIINNNNALPDKNDINCTEYQFAENNPKDFTVGTKLTHENCVEVLLNANKYRIDDLRLKALKYVSDHLETLPMDDIEQMDARNLRDVLLCNQTTDDETEIFERLEQWMNQNEFQADVASEMLKSICLARIPNVFIVENIESLFKKYGCERMVMDEYRKRLLMSPQTMFLHPTASLFCATVDDNNHEINILEYDFDLNLWNEFQNIPLNTETYSYGYGYVSTKCDIALVFLNGTLFVMGGSYGNGLHYYGRDQTNEVESYDMDSLTKMNLRSMKHSRTGFTPICIGKFIYVFGGYNSGILDACERFDTEWGVWETLASMPHASYDYAAVEFKGKIYVGGGSNDTDTCRIDHLQCYNPDTDTWSEKARMPTTEKTVFAKSNDVLYALEPNQYIYQYDVNRNEWTTAYKMDNFGTVIGAINYCDQIHLLCETGTFDTFQMGENNNVIRLNSMGPRRYGVTLFSNFLNNQIR